MNQVWIILIMLGAGGSAAGSPGAPDFSKDIRPLFESYCFKCHGEDRKKGGIDLQSFESVDQVYRDPKTWETVLRVLQEEEMPPEDKPQPELEERKRLVDWVEHTLNHPDEAQLPKDPGRVTLHRLSRLEYNNSVRDLFGVTSRPADTFPADGGGGGGFDNNADTLFLPPILMERLLEVAASVLEEADPDRLWVVRPGADLTEDEAALGLLTHHATRAYRRPARDEEIESLRTIYAAERARGETFEASIQQALKAVLISPHFLFRVETDQDVEGPYRLSAFELATRLSYFLWASVPDEALFDAARSGALLEETRLRQEVRRMLADPKSAAFAESFAGQWLGVDRLHTSAQPDPERFPSYTVELRDAMVREPIELFRHVVLENRSVLEWLDSDYTFANQVLAEHYGWSGVAGEAFQRVSLTDSNRGGVTGMAAILTLTSYPLRTSPVLRGKWVLEEILGTPPPPPPPMIKSLPRDDRPRDGLSFRQRLEKHREDANCAACHKRMDPLGFALEHFDAIGRWRTEIGGAPVDASAQLPTGETFEGAADLKRVLLSRQDQFINNLVERMLAYALGRGLEYYDRPAVKAIVAALIKEDYRAQVLVLEVVESFPFQYRRNDLAVGEAAAAR